MIEKHVDQIQTQTHLKDHAKSLLLEMFHTNGIVQRFYLVSEIVGFKKFLGCIENNNSRIFKQTKNKSNLL